MSKFSRLSQTNPHCNQTANKILKLWKIKVVGFSLFKRRSEFSRMLLNPLMGAEKRRRRRQPPPSPPYTGVGVGGGGGGCLVKVEENLH